MKRKRKEKGKKKRKGKKKEKKKKKESALACYTMNRMKGAKTIIPTPFKITMYIYSVLSYTME